MPRKAKYASGRKPTVLTGRPLSPNAGVASRYDRRLRALIALMTTETLRGVRSLFAEQHPADVFALDAGIADQAKHLMASLTFKFDNLFASHSKPIATLMIEENADASEAAIKASMSALAEGLSLNTGSITAELGDVFTASIAENVGLIKSIPQQYLQQVQGEVYRAITSGNGLSELVPALQKYKGVTERRARLIASDQTRKSFANINRLRLEKMGVKKFKWVHSSAGNEPRPLHKNVLNGEIFRFDEPPIIDDKTGERGFPGQLINCFTGDTRVSSESGIIRIYRSPFKGQIVDIMAGRILSATPNHPILTRRGWVSASKIRKGDYLIEAVEKTKFIIESNHDESHPTFDELFLAFRDHAKSALGREFDFYGDIPNGDVDTITFAHPLTLDLVSDILKTPSDFFFSNTDGAVLNIYRTGSGGHILESGAPCIEDEGTALFRREAAHANKAGVSSISFSDSMTSQNPSDDLSANRKLSAEEEFAVTGSVKGNNLAFGQVGDFSGGRSATALDFDSHISQMEAEIIGGASDSLGGFCQSGSFEYKFARVVDSVLRSFSGHVYTLETVNGWYNVTLANFIVKNCKCRASPIISFDED